MRRILNEHFRYVSDSSRIAAYRSALAQTLKPGDIVLDLGCGTGILGLLACQAGATKVFAVDRGGIIEIARQLAAANGWSDRITHLRGESAHVELPERADVLVCDQLGPLGFDAGIVGACRDAVRRLLKPGARLIPRSFATRLAPVDAPRTYAEIDRWATPVEGLRLDAVRRKATNVLHPIVHERAVRLGQLVDAFVFALESADDLAMPLRTNRRWTVQQPGILHGLEGSFRADLAPGVTITNDASDPDHIKRLTVLLPIDTPAPVETGDEVEADLLINPGRVVSWEVKITRPGAPPVSFSHSTLRGLLLPGGESSSPSEIDS